VNVASLGVGVVGLGVGERHARAFAAHPSCELRSLFDLDRARADSLAAALPPARPADSYAAMLADPAIDVVAIASFDDAHYEQVTAALDAGKHVFVEKPLSRTLEELSDIKRRWTTAGERLHLGSNLVLRAAPAYVWLRDQVRAGRFGEIYSFDGDYLYGRIHKITGGWRGGVDNYSVIEGGGVHLIDLLLWVTGQRPVAVTAAANKIATRGSSFRYNDFVTATFEFASGLIARITANFGCVQPHQHVVRVFGTQATFAYDDSGPRWWQSRDPQHAAAPIELSALPADKGALVPGFVSAIVNDLDDRDETQAVFDGIAICIAADRAAASGQRQHIEYI
jgi:predicted dehydrogenase